MLEWHQLTLRRLLVQLRQGLHYHLLLLVYPLRDCTTPAAATCGPARAAAPAPDRTTCDDCNAGTVSASAGLGVCTDCSAGMVATSDGLTACTRCPGGWYQPSYGSTGCPYGCPAVRTRAMFVLWGCGDLRGVGGRDGGGPKLKGGAHGGWERHGAFGGPSLRMIDT